MLAASDRSTSQNSLELIPILHEDALNFLITNRQVRQVRQGIEEQSFSASL
ncbi:hypothetical protein [Nostoc sp. CCY 9925]|uniref:hypothetical protein n=1 Tax=Nostoc sp. CCY 9925 TaxID=3103865 RepID=UPI0039C75567